MNLFFALLGSISSQVISNRFEINRSLIDEVAKLVNTMKGFNRWHAILCTVYLSNKFSSDSSYQRCVKNEYGNGRQVQQPKYRHFFFVAENLQSVQSLYIYILRLSWLNFEDYIYIYIYIKPPIFYVIIFIRRSLINQHSGLKTFGKKKAKLWTKLICSLLVSYRKISVGVALNITRTNQQHSRTGRSMYFFPIS